MRKKSILFLRLGGEGGAGFAPSPLRPYLDRQTNLEKKIQKFLKSLVEFGIARYCLRGAWEAGMGYLEGILIRAHGTPKFDPEPAGTMPIYAEILRYDTIVFQKGLHYGRHRSSR